MRDCDIRENLEEIEIGKGLAGRKKGRTKNGEADFKREKENER